ncbi:MAG: response regulator [Gammaproteobacteria bacterium]|nr:response regulator [Gammaproteobacteria bacterium]
MKTILIVDDEPSVRKMLQRMLATATHKVLEAGNGIEAEALIVSNEVDLLITDIVMPEKHGIDLIMTLKEKLPELPIIAISGGGGVTGRFDYLEVAALVGARNVLRKPFQADELRQLVDEIIT